MEAEAEVLVGLLLMVGAAEVEGGEELGLVFRLERLCWPFGRLRRLLADPCVHGHQLLLLETVPMPANNLSVIFCLLLFIYLHAEGIHSPISFF